VRIRIEPAYNRFKVQGVLMSRIALALVALLLAPVAAAPEDTPQTAQIRVSTRLVRIGVIVRDKNGVAANLTKSDFTILDRGKPQQISVFAADAAASLEQPRQQPLPRNTFSDVPRYGTTTPRGVTIVLLDNLNTLYGSQPESKYEATPYWVEDHALQRARVHLLEFLKTLDPMDRVAIYGLRDSLHVLCDFTSDRAQLLAVVSKYDTSSSTNRAVVEPALRTAPDFDGVVPQGSASFENGAALNLARMANEERAQITMAALASIANHVANIPGRKNLVWLTAELPFSGAAMAHILAPANIAVYPVDARGLLARQTPTSAILTGTADADDVSGASGHLDNMPAQSTRPVGIATMQKLADETGGQAFVDTNDITGAIRKAVEDSAVTYTLGFYIPRSELDGKFHELKVEVKGNGLTVRYPKGYFAFPDTEATKDEDQARLVTAVQSPIQSSSIPLQATLERVNEPRADSLNLVCSIDLHGIRFTQSGNLRKGTVVVYVIEQDKTGKTLLRWDKGYNLQFTESQYAALLKSGIPFRQNVEPRPGATTLRVLVEDPATSEVGSLIIPLSQIK
jgi:VWFA-related protein